MCLKDSVLGLGLHEYVLIHMSVENVDLILWVIDSSVGKASPFGAEGRGSESQGLTIPKV